MKKFIGGGCCGKKKGFTLIELLIVVAIIGLLATLAILSLTSAQAKARDTKRVADMKSMQNAVEMYYNDNSIYPSTTTWTLFGTALTGGTTSYLNAMPAPPNTDALYEYEYSSNGTDYCFRVRLEKDNQILDQDVDTNDCTISGGTINRVGSSANPTAALNCTADGTTYDLCLGS